MNEVRNRNLMNYITFVKNLEVSVYEQQRVISNLNNKIVRAYSGEKYKETCTYKSFGEVLKMFACAWGIGGIVGIFTRWLWSLCFEFDGRGFGDTLDFFFSEGRFFGFTWEMIKTGFFVGGAIGILVAFLIWAKSFTSLKKMDKKTNAENAEIERRNRVNAQNIEKKNELLIAESNIVKGNLEKTNKILDHVYAMNIIHEKYRHNLVYICSIFEYFDTGRCNKLEGHEGAYNLLESDIKYQLIMDKLDIIINKLDDIKDSQRELYHAISNTNRNVEQVSSSINRLSDNMSNALDNLNSIEYNSRISRQNGEFLKWYAYFRN